MSACQTTPQDENEAITTNATLLWSGEIAADGCGFEIEIDGKTYLPENEDAIPAKFKESESSEVKLTYLPLKDQIDRRCGMLPQPRVMDAVRVVSVTAL
ncbi:hypothetical protein [Pontibacter cellulosilyticus]|uniref:Uncharacterized protein n=1 Tax=Pontibacter cellulosilyticus TaxID=1720253 RepID=A0A923N8H0_9BACT|nr:hypothetical protein [Pontibacter cellulosilyticus]MBC5992390.1 hypothetical protein [Pontibacter cellulosilyticus]